MTDDERRAHSQRANSARAARLILAALDGGHASRDAVGRVVREFGDCPSSLVRVLVSMHGQS